MSSIPAPVSRSGARSRGPTLAHGHHAETNPRTLVGLQKAGVQLQRELEKIDRQAFTAVSNIANHQQAMKMSWRRLEARRSSPQLQQRSFSCSDQQTASPGLRRSLLSSNTTKLSLAATPQIYSGSPAGPVHQQSRTAGSPGRRTEATGPGPGRTGTRAADDSDLGKASSVSLLPHRQPNPSPALSSPYLSSPYMYRHKMRASSPTKTAAPPLTSTTASAHPPSSQVKLPPIFTTSSQPSLVATTNKHTLLKVSHMMGLDSHSHGPENFHAFYSDTVTARSEPTLFSKDQLEDDDDNEGERGEEGGGEEVGGEDGRELTLAEQFEQIRRCRYIRHYRPHGTAVEEL